MTRHAVFANSAAALARVAFAGSNRRKMPGAAAAMPTENAELVPPEFVTTTVALPPVGSSKGTSRLIWPAERSCFTV